MSMLLNAKPENQVRNKRRLKPNPVMSMKERVHETLDLIEKMGNITRLVIQDKLGYGCGVMDRVHRAMMSMFSDEVSWNPKKQMYYWIENPKIKGMLV